jgi:hypothetical protein
MKRRRYSEHDEDVIRRGYAVDRPINEIAAELGRSRSEIAHYVSECLHITDKSRGGRMAAASIGPEGCRQRGLAGMAALKAHGYDLTGAAPRGVRPEPRWYRRARELRRAGEKLEYIAMIVGRSPWRVWAVCRGIVVTRAHRPDSVSVANSVPHLVEFPSRETRPCLPLDRRPTA